MRSPEIESYAPPFILGEAISGYGFGVAIRSEDSDVKPGQHLYGTLSHEEYSVRASLEEFETITRDEGLPLPSALEPPGCQGRSLIWPGKSTRAKKGEVAYVTTGAGAVGSFVIQLAKLDGLKVIASAGSDEEVRYMREIGADVAFNYKTTSIDEVLAKEGPGDVFWDNVGGKTLDSALEAANVGARFIMSIFRHLRRVVVSIQVQECGMISGYNGVSTPVKNLMLVVAKSISINEFLVYQLYDKYDAEFYATVPPKLASGEISYLEDVSRGLDQVGEALLAVHKGTNKGKGGGGG